jgi:hypothetical protein
MPRPSHFSRFYHPHNSGWGLQIMELFIMKFSPHPCYLVPLRLSWCNNKHQSINMHGMNRKNKKISSHFVHSKRREAITQRHIQKWRIISEILQKLNGGNAISNQVLYRYVCTCIRPEGKWLLHIQLKTLLQHADEEDEMLDSRSDRLNPLNAELYPICHLLALLGAQHILHVSRIRVNPQKTDYHTQSIGVCVRPETVWTH